MKMPDLWWEEVRGGTSGRGMYDRSKRASNDRGFPWPTGYLIIHVVQSLCGMLIMYGLVLPIIHNQGLEMLQGLGIGT